MRVSWASVSLWVVLAVAAVLFAVDRFGARAPEAVAPAAQREVVVVPRSRAPGTSTPAARRPGPPPSTAGPSGPAVLVGPDGTPYQD